MGAQDLFFTVFLCVLLKFTTIYTILPFLKIKKKKLAYKNIVVYIGGWLDGLQDPALPAVTPSHHVMENNNDSLQSGPSCFQALSQAYCQE